MWLIQLFSYMILASNRFILNPFHSYSINLPLLYSKPPSFIDFNSDKSFEGEMNKGLGNETLIYEDSDMLVFNKPSFAQTTRGAVVQDSLASRVQLKYNLPSIDQMIVHRLDYATSGIVIFALNPNSLRNLHTQFREHQTMYKRYVAVVDGVFRSSLEGEIDVNLGRDDVRGPPLHCIRPDGKRSITYWSVRASCIERNKTLIDLVPKTGRCVYNTVIYYVQHSSLICIVYDVYACTLKPVMPVIRRLVVYILFYTTILTIYPGTSYMHHM